MSDVSPVHIRPMDESDVDFVLTVENNLDIWNVSENNSSYSLDDIKQLYEDLKNIEKAKQARYIICEEGSGDRIGTVDLTDIDFEKGIASVGILIHALEDRRKGYASRALDLIESIANELRITKLHAVVHQGNEASNRLFLKSGYDRVTDNLNLDRTNGEFINVEHYLKCIKS